MFEQSCKQGAGALGLACLILPGAASAAEFEYRGYLEPELQLFTQSPSDRRQEDWNASLAAEATLEYFWDDGYQAITFVPFGRLDRADDERTHADIRELNYELVRGNWEVRVGLDKVFWGVTEAVHLVDIINQTDLIESLDGEEKLGQPMVNVSTVQDWGTIDLFLLPYFRERTFAGTSGRPRIDVPVNTDDALFESGDEEEHIDWAVRYSNTFGAWDVGVAHFSGTGREPVLLPRIGGSGLELVPFYPLIDQTSVDVQATIGAWLYKLEALSKDQLDERIFQATGGIEYTLYGVFDTPADLGIVAEYVFDERRDDAPGPFNNDVFGGLRWAANDVDGTSVLAGAVVDLDTQATAFSIEAERRIGANYQISLESRFFTNIPSDDPFFSFEDDDFVQLRLARYF